MENTDTHLLQQRAVDLNTKSNIVLRVGKICLASGTGSYRVKQSMSKVAAILGVENQAQITLTEIASTCRQGLLFKTEVCNLHSVGVNTDRIEQIEKLVLTLEKQSKQMGELELIQFINLQLNLIENKSGLYRPLITSLSSAMACSSFTFLVGGGLIEMLGVFIAAGIGHYIRRLLAGRHINHFLGTMVAAAIAASVYFLILTSIQFFYQIDSQHEAGYIASMLFLIPGFPLITGVLDIAKLDFSSGLQRISYALTIIFCATFSAWMVAACFKMEPHALLTPHLDTPFLILFRMITTFCGVLGFSLMFNSPLRTAVAAATIGMFANTFRLESINLLGLPDQAAALIAACIVGISAAFLSKKIRCPRISLSVPAVCIMVPGVFMFRAVYYLEQNDILNAINWTVQALLIVVALPLGLVFARVITDKEWGYDAAKK